MEVLNWMLAGLLWTIVPITMLAAMIFIGILFVMNLDPFFDWCAEKPFKRISFTIFALVLTVQFCIFFAYLVKTVYF